VARHVAQNLSLERSEHETKVIRTVADSLLAVLLSPANVQLIAKAGAESKAEDCLVLCLTAGLGMTVVDVPEADGEDYWDDVIDLSSSSTLVRRSYGLDDDHYWEERRLKAACGYS
jgi:hypothetical protein